MAKRNYKTVIESARKKLNSFQEPIMIDAMLELLNWIEKQIQNNKPINQCKKGKVWEREVVKILKSWTALDFRRTDGSGAIKDAYTYAHELGDVRPKDPEDFEIFPFVVECKSYKNIGWHQIINGDCSLLDSWLDQLEGDVNSFNSQVAEKKLRGLLFFNVDNKPNMVATLFPWKLPTELHNTVVVYKNRCSIFPIQKLTQLHYTKNFFNK